MSKGKWLRPSQKSRVIENFEKLRKEAQTKGRNWIPSKLMEYPLQTKGFPNYNYHILRDYFKTVGVQMQEAGEGVYWDGIKIRKNMTVFVWKV